MAWAKVLVVVAVTLGPVVLLMQSLSLSTNYWITFTVDRSKLSKTEVERSSTNSTLSFYHSRSRGLFRECFTGPGAIKFLDKNRDSDCVNILYEPPREMKYTASQDYWNRLHLMRCHFAFLVLGLAAFLLAYMLGVVLCCQKRSMWAKASGVFAYLSAFASAASVAFFHGVEYMERSVIKSNEDGYMFFANWSKDLQEATVRRYDWSYILCWVGAVLAAICGTLYVVAAWLIQNNRKNEESRKVLPKRFLAERNVVPGMMTDATQYPYDAAHYKYYNPEVYVGPYVYEMSDGSGDHAVWQWQ